MTRPFPSVKTRTSRKQPDAMMKNASDRKNVKRWIKIPVISTNKRKKHRHDADEIAKKNTPKGYAFVERIIMFPHDEKCNASYLTHDNGDRPYKVKITDNHVGVFTASYCEHDDQVLCYEMPDNVLIGENYGQGSEDGDFNGSAILIKPTEKLKYVYVGSEIFEFESKTPICTFIANIGNNDVPYTYAISDSHMFLFEERKVFDLDKFSFEALEEYKTGYEDPYDAFYRCKEEFYGAEQLVIKMIK